MRILILGGDGMLGHRLLRHLSARHDVRVTLRQDAAAYAKHGLFTLANAFFGIDLRDLARVVGVLAAFRPEAIVNCAGIIKQRNEAKATETSIEINSLLPHRLAALARADGTRLVHMSTDCVFSGSRGGYSEEDPSDAADIYGRSKHLGEVSGEGCITLRSSIVGLQLARKTSLLEWFLAQRGKSVTGFRRVIFSGFTTAEMARIIERVLLKPAPASGLYHVSSAPISKYDLLSRINAACGLGVRIAADDEFVCDRSLNSVRFRSEFGYEPPSWDTMIAELAGEIRADQSLSR